METCNCNLLCQCLPSSLTAKPTEEDCKAAVAVKIAKGQKDGIKLDGLSFVLLLHSPSAMAEGNITAGLTIDERASVEQVAAIRDIALGAAGDPMAALRPLVGRVAGVERRPISFVSTGMTHVVRCSSSLLAGVAEPPAHSGWVSITGFTASAAAGP